MRQGCFQAATRGAEERHLASPCGNVLTHITVPWAHSPARARQRLCGRGLASLWAVATMGKWPLL
eukprot:14855908-Alexandrium_andersonii.AAC.1